MNRTLPAAGQVKRVESRHRRGRLKSPGTKPARQTRRSEAPLVCSSMRDPTAWRQQPAEGRQSANQGAECEKRSAPERHCLGNERGPSGADDIIYTSPATERGHGQRQDANLDKARMAGNTSRMLKLGGWMVGCSIRAS